MNKTYGLIGYPLGHSFSKNYFSDKFRKENIPDATYENFEISDIGHFPDLLSGNQNIMGLNVTIPYKESIIGFLDSLDTSAKRVGAVNVIKLGKNHSRVGYNTDYFGFRKSLEGWLQRNIQGIKALVLGTGGSSKAVCAVLEDCNIEFLTISRSDKGDKMYYQLHEKMNLLDEYRLLINTTPLGMHPRTNEMPNIPYQTLGHSHFLYDLIYNPEKTLFLEKGEQSGAQIKNGQEMLILQAEKSWEIWNENN